MKQNIGTPAIVAAIILVVAIAGFFGYRALSPGSAAPKPAGLDSNSRYQQQYQNYNQQRPATGNPMSPGGGRPGP